MMGALEELIMDSDAIAYFRNFSWWMLLQCGGTHEQVLLWRLAFDTAVPCIETFIGFSAPTKAISDLVFKGRMLETYSSVVNVALESALKFPT